MPYDVCLDAGHGSDTVGNKSPDGKYAEWEFARDLCNRIKDLLEYNGVSVFLTVPGDKDVTLKKRCALANNSGAKIVISIHSNAVGSSWNNTNYFMTCIVAKGGNAEKLGNIICQEFTNSFPDVKNNGNKVQNLAIVRDTTAPAVLIEHGFHTNKEWVTNVLLTDEGRQKLAKVDAQAICRYFNIEFKENNKTDTPSDWAKQAWEKAKNKIGSDGKSILDGTRPQDNVTREEISVVLDRLNLLE